MPSKLIKQVSYTLDVELPTLGFTEKGIALNESKLAEACREVEELYKMLSNVRGSVPLPRRSYSPRSSIDIPNKVLEYARTHQEWTLKSLATDTGLNIKSIYNVVAKLVEDKKLKKEQVGMGLSNVYRLNSAVEVSSKPQPTNSANPERERMQAR